jgi:uncharacterized protein (TIGR01244 family)
MSLLLSLALLAQPAPEIVDLAGTPSQADLDRWRAQGATRVVTLFTEDEIAALDYDLADAVAARGMIHSIVPTGREAGALTADQLAAVLGDAQGPVVVHCRSGTRASHLYAAARIRQGALDPQDYRSAAPQREQWREDLVERYVGAEID